MFFTKNIQPETQFEHPKEVQVYDPQTEKPADIPNGLQGANTSQKPLFKDAPEGSYSVNDDSYLK